MVTLVDNLHFWSIGQEGLLHESLLHASDVSPRVVPGDVENSPLLTVFCKLLLLLAVLLLLLLLACCLPSEEELDSAMLSRLLKGRVGGYNERRP